MTSAIPVSDADRELYIKLKPIEVPRHHELVRKGTWDHVGDLQDIARHRLAALDEAAEVLRECEQTFRFYEQSHLAKKTRESDEKAYRNKVMADKCTAILALKETSDAK